MILQKRICSYCDGEGRIFPDLTQPNLHWICTPCKGDGYLVVDVEQRISDLEEDIRDATEELVDLKMFVYETLNLQ